jgi:hypothetical protein
LGLFGHVSVLQSSILEQARANAFDEWECATAVD